MARKRKPKRRERRAIAGLQFDRAKALLARWKIELRRCCETHYQAEHTRDRWLLNLWPSTGRTYAEPRRPPPPAVSLGHDWDLLAVAEALIDAMDRQECARLRAQYREGAEIDRRFRALTSDN